MLAMNSLSSVVMTDSTASNLALMIGSNARQRSRQDCSHVFTTDNRVPIYRSY